MLGETVSLANPGCSAAIAHRSADFLAPRAPSSFIVRSSLGPHDAFIFVGKVTDEYKEVSGDSGRGMFAFSAHANA